MFLEIFGYLTIIYINALFIYTDVTNQLNHTANPKYSCEVDPPLILNHREFTRLPAFKPVAPSGGGSVNIRASDSGVEWPVLVSFEALRRPYPAVSHILEVAKALEEINIGLVCLQAQQHIEYCLLFLLYTNWLYCVPNSYVAQPAPNALLVMGQCCAFLDRAAIARLTKRVSLPLAALPHASLFFQSGSATHGKITFGTSEVGQRVAVLSGMEPEVSMLWAH